MLHNYEEGEGIIDTECNFAMEDLGFGFKSECVLNPPAPEGLL